MVASVTKSVDLPRRRDDSVGHEVAFLRRSVDEHLVRVAYHRRWTQVVDVMPEALRDSTHRVDRDVVEEPELI